ncbi:MAG: AgmX/PglI C-terminal domain-containing protein [Bdellovibrionales bacterium]|jgi:outer membrane biosynthesis protein TonB|nr:AgmX/PglI C-terminal domain-containing protein [Bdellovibrionales bacterium]
MGQPALFLEHKKDGKQTRRHRVTAERRLFVIGSSRDADLRIGGENVQGCHAVLQFRSPHWYVKSLAVETGIPVRVNDQEVIEAVVSEETKIEIGGNRIELFSKQRTESLFSDGEKTAGPLDLHQIVISNAKGKIIETKVVPAGQPYHYFDGEKSIPLVSPPSAEWVETTLERKTVRQRLVSRQELAAAEGIHVDQDLKKPAAAAFLLVFLMIGSLLLLSKFSSKEEPTVALDQKSIDMIFNAEAIKKKRTEAKKVTQTAKQRSGGSSDAQVATPVAMPNQSTAPVQSEKATAALNSIRNAGLSNLVGKIAKRANTNGIMVGAQGVSPDTKGAGRALFSNGTSTTGGGGTAAVAGDSYRLGGIATKGVGGGATGVRDGTGLAGGTVGTGDVAMVDEETVIEGGLDRDVIADVIRRNLGQIRYCYERQLSSNPDLYGKLLVRFTIDAGGGVLEPKVDTSTLKSSLVEGCVLRRLAGWKFPLPKGGTQVRVSYPFLFKALD